jgi:hypothetical protein
LSSAPKLLEPLNSDHSTATLSGCAASGLTSTHYSHQETALYDVHVQAFEERASAAAQALKPPSQWMLGLARPRKAASQMAVAAHSHSI